MSSKSKRNQNKKMPSQKIKKQSCFVTSIFPITMLFLISLFLYMDIKQSGHYKASQTHAFLRDYGVYEFCHNTMNMIRYGVALIEAKMEETFPGFLKSVKEHWQPYGQLFCELGKWSQNMAFNLKEAFMERYPVIIQSINSYAPGLVEQSQNAVLNAYATSIFYFNRSVDYLRKEVFVGQLSPENMQKVVIQALNTTQQKATEYYHWIYQKVQTTIK